jgi:hypothetical protein
MGRQALILVVGFSILAGLIKLNLGSGHNRSDRLSNDKYCMSVARTAANSGAQMALGRLRQNLNWRAGLSHLNLSNATTNVAIADANTDSTLGVDSVRITSQSSFMNQNATVSMLVVLGHPVFPPNVKSGITARANIGTLGNMLVDGRDHDIDGHVISNQGMDAITTMGTYVCGGSTALCGTTDMGLDFGPVRSGYSSIVQEHYVWPGSSPNTPEEVLGGAGIGLGTDDLKAVAQSGANGSQYVTDPSLLHYPLNGVTYVELPDHGVWSALDFGPDSRGILVVHNANRNALMSNLNGGTFRGLLISDDIMHVHSVIVGGVFVLTTNPAAGNCIGNGSGSVLFSRSSIQQALEGAQLGLGTIHIADCWE